MLALAKISNRNIFYVISILTLSLLLRIIFFGNRDLLVEEAYYWNYAIHLDFGYLDHPPLIALLIKLSTGLFGTNESAVRFPGLLAWLVTVYFSYKWTELLQKGAGIFAVLLLSILPFFFLYSIFMTPDSLLMACWSALLYMLYQALCCNKVKAWYYAGFILGLGLLSKYSILLLVFTTGVYLLVTPEARIWFSRKEPYIGLLIALLLFSPVIYWNAMHDWASFAFQSTRRIQKNFYFSFHYLIGLWFLFLTPVGLLESIKLLKKSSYDIIGAHKNTIRFLRYYTLIPLIIFALFSLSRQIKFDWIGPIVLALIPWFALLCARHFSTILKWIITSITLLIIYAAILFCVTYGQPEEVNKRLFFGVISWNNFTQELYKVAQNLEAKGEKPAFASLESYNIASELVFYQTKQFKKHQITQVFPVRGAQVFGFGSLMFDYWYKSDSLKGKTIILLSRTPDLFTNPAIPRVAIALSPVTAFFGRSQGELEPVREYYYQLVRLKPDVDLNINV